MTGVADTPAVLVCVPKRRLASSNCVVGLGGVRSGMEGSWANGWLGKTVVAGFHADRPPQLLSTDVDLVAVLDLELENSMTKSEQK